VGDFEVATGGGFWVAVRVLDESSINLLKTYILKGGSLFIEGEHTNLDGVQNEIDKLIACTGIQLNFDTTNGALGDGLKSITFFNHPLSIMLKREPLTTYNRGASLKINSLNAYPLISGNAWHGDKGNLLNEKKGFLGNYEVEKGDSYGNIILMAIWEKKGKVFISGDTTPFLNNNIGYNSRFISYLFEYLSNHSVTYNNYYITLCILVIICILMYLSNKLLIKYIVLLIILIIYNSALSLPIISMPPKTLLVVSNLNNDIDSNEFSHKSVTALMVHSQRCAIVPILGKIHENIKLASHTAIINPRMDISDKYWNEMKQKVSNGAKVILSGSGDNPFFSKLISKVGVSISNFPIGTVNNQTYFPCAWELSGLNPLITANGKIIAGEVILGKGKFLIIGDANFLLNEGLEPDHKYNLNNLNFLRNFYFND